MTENAFVAKKLMTKSFCEVAPGKSKNCEMACVDILRTIEVTNFVDIIL
jgi:hypothetical protein